MEKFLTKILITTLAALAVAYVMKGVHIDSFIAAFLLSLVLALLNSFVKPVLILLTLPITVLTLGLFLLVINVVIIKLAASLVPGFSVAGWWPALLFSLLLSIFTAIIESLVGNHIKK